MAQAKPLTTSQDQPEARLATQDAGLAIGVVAILAILFLPLPAFVIDLGLALSIALAILILMVALWIERPLDFSAFPTVLLIATLLRLSLNIATTRLILTQGHAGELAAGHTIAGFAKFVMGGDFAIGVIIFMILITINFIVITKGATRIAEVGARFSLDAMPGKQMAIDADLSSGVIDDKVATQRRRELEEESAFFGAMDGASKFVRGDAIAGIIITGINIFGGIGIGLFRHGMGAEQALDTFMKLSVGDGLVTQIPALIVSLAAGLLVSKGGARGSTEKALFGQLSNYPRAVMAAAAVVGLLALAPGLPMLPFALLSAMLFASGRIVPQKRAAASATRIAAEKSRASAKAEPAKAVQAEMRGPDVELKLGKQLFGSLLRPGGDVAMRVAKIRRKFARRYGFIIPDIRLSDELNLAPKAYQIAIHDTVVSSGELRPGELLVIVGDGPRPSIAGEATREPAFGINALWIPEIYNQALKEEGFAPVDNVSVVLTHMSEVLRANLAHLLTYRDLRLLIDGLEPAYKRLVEEICPSHISHSTLLSVLKLLLAERISIRNLHLILEAVAEIAPFSRKAEQIVEHVRVRLSPQICGDLSDNGTLKVMRLSNRWEQAFQQGLRRDAKGSVIEFDVAPNLIEQFGEQLVASVRPLMNEGQQFVLVTAAELRPYVRMVTERLFPGLAVLSHGDVSRSSQIRYIGSIP